MTDRAGKDDSLSDLLPIEQAAKKAKMRRERFRAMCIRAGIAIRWGGTERHPRLKVRMRDVEAVILGNRFRPPKKSRVPNVPSHPLVKC